MSKNIFNKPPDLKEDPAGFQAWADSIHNSVYGQDHTGGTLDVDNLLAADDPGTADGTEAGNASTINTLVANLKTTGVVNE